MEYTINALSKISGISTRTLRYYDEIGLLCPQRLSSNGYRIYGKSEVDLLEQILYYKALDMPLDSIKTIIADDNFNKITSLNFHLKELIEKRNYIDNLIESVQKSILHNKGEIKMNDNDKFSAFKKTLINENMKNYGDEITEKYSNDTVLKSNAKVMKMSEDEFCKQETLSTEIIDLLRECIKTESPSSEKAMTLCQKHAKWLKMFWPDDMYTKEIHMSLAYGYLADDRFKLFYDNACGEGATQFLVSSLEIYTKK